jgi:hypothetical protein
MFQIPQEDVKRKPSLNSSEQKPNIKNDCKQVPNSASANGKHDAVKRNSINNKRNSGNGLFCALGGKNWDVFRNCTL